MSSLRFAAIGASLLLMTSAPAAPARVSRAGLTLSERCRVQEIVERVEYRHRAGATAGFEETVSRRAIKRKVAGQIEAEALLVARTGRALSTAELEAELSRIEMETRDPERLRELREALGHRWLLDGWVRPVLVGRLLLDGSDRIAEAAGKEEAVRPGWKKIPPLPESWYGNCAVWTGTRMIVWGGGNIAGRSYDPTPHAWSSISTAGQPPPTYGCAAVWTGAEMIVWGGVDLSGPVNSGGRYDPVSDTWAPVSAVGAPSLRQDHTAIWTGSEMIVWGGLRGTSTNTGGRYDPATDNWTPVSTAGSPGPRKSHGAVWTGREMIVWGGCLTDPNLPYLTGGRYDPSTDSWLSIAVTTATPAARSFHTTVWTGREMIVWGGSSSSFGADFGDGARYDPATDTWDALPAAGAPVPRRFHGAVWTGREMIVWGGARTATSGSTILADGASYSPSSDVWSPLKGGNSPYARYAFTTLWSGKEMLVWGGLSRVYGLLNDGGAYAPPRRLTTSGAAAP